MGYMALNPEPARFEEYFRATWIVQIGETRTKDVSFFNV